MLKEKSQIIYLFGLFFVYQMVGVAVHKQYGFGFFYWPIQMYGMALISFLYYILHQQQIYKTIAKTHLLNLYVLFLLVFQIFYLLNPYFYVQYLEKEELINIFFETVIWYFILIVMIILYERLIKLLNIKIMLLLYIFILIFFFMYVIKLNQSFSSDISRAFWIGANFPTLDIDVFLTQSGYVKGFHLYFSPLFSIFSIAFISILKKENLDKEAYIIFFLSLYILFLASGRGSLLSFVVVTLFFYFREKSFISVFLLLATIVLLLISNGFSELLLEKNQRLFDLFTLDFEEDNSSIGRLHQLEMNVKYIYENWLTGGIRSYYAILGKGEYIHNVLSVLQEYGILIFGILVLIFFKGLYLVVNKNDSFYILTLSKAIFVYMLLEAILFKNIHEVKILVPLMITYYYLVNFKGERNES